MKRFASLYLLLAVVVAVLISTGKYLSAQQEIPCENPTRLALTNGASWAKGTASNPTVVTVFVDGYITILDSIFSSLRLWQDTNHDGVSTPSELHSLASLEVASIELDYKLSKYKDANGNTFKYRAKIRNDKGVQMGAWVYDVFLNARRAR
ncbi:MAG TPA: hypothetical protein VFD48_06065 [Pyrinomonadaceae bacterium]|nr:hypothetical protein [Pyrinomonadaceae bacterium]